MQYALTRLAAPAALLLLSACSATVGGPGPAGPPGPPGPPGPAAQPGPLRLQVQTAAANMEIGAATDVVIATAAVTITLPAASAAGAGRTITIRNAVVRPPGAPPSFRDSVDVRVGPLTDRLERQQAISLERDEMVTLISDGIDRWTLIAASDL